MLDHRASANDQVARFHFSLLNQGCLSWMRGVIERMKSCLFYCTVIWVIRRTCVKFTTIIWRIRQKHCVDSYFLLKLATASGCLLWRPRAGMILILGLNLECNFGSSNKGFVGVCIVTNNARCFKCGSISIHFYSLSITLCIHKYINWCFQKCMEIDRQLKGNECMKH